MVCAENAPVALYPRTPGPLPQPHLVGSIASASLHALNWKPTHRSTAAVPCALRGHGNLAAATKEPLAGAGAAHERSRRVCAGRCRSCTAAIAVVVDAESHGWMYEYFVRTNTVRMYCTVRSQLCGRTPYEYNSRNHGFFSPHTPRGDENWATAAKAIARVHKTSIQCIHGSWMPVGRRPFAAPPHLCQYVLVLRCGSSAIKQPASLAPHRGPHTVACLRSEHRAVFPASVKIVQVASLLFSY